MPTAFRAAVTLTALLASASCNDPVDSRPPAEAPLLLPWSEIDGHLAVTFRDSLVVIDGSRHMLTPVMDLLGTDRGVNLIAVSPDGSQVAWEQRRAPRVVGGQHRRQEPAQPCDVPTVLLVLVERERQ